MTNMDIAKTILNQIKILDCWFLIAIGARNYVALDETMNRLGGITFQVNGLKHKGWCTVELTPMDTYRVLFINRKGETIKIVEECYCDQLVSILDFVEGR